MSPKSIEQFYLRLYDRMVRRPGVVLAATAAALVLSLAVLPGVRLDMSFRPFFATGDEAAIQTAEFERVFGQRSGAHIGVVIERDDVLTTSFLSRIEALSEEISNLDHVSDVQSLTHVSVPVWSGDDTRWIRSTERLDGRAFSDDDVQKLAADLRLRGVLLSEDGRKTLLLARLALPLQDLEGRTAVIRAFRSQVTAALGDAAILHFVGVSVVEEAYSRIVLASLARSFALTTLALLGLLWLIYRRIACLAVAMTGVTLAVPVSLALMTGIGQDLTMINSMLPVMVLIIGVADAIHMLESFYRRWSPASDRRRAVRSMFGEMALPCLLTTVTTAAGFLALHLAQIDAIRDFGLAVALGIVAVYLLNLITVPMLLHRLPVTALRRPPSPLNRVDRWIRGSSIFVVNRSTWLVASSLLLIAACVASLPFLEVDQRFNSEVAADHPIRAGQALLEQEFTGVLGPELGVRRRDGAPVTTADARQRISALQEAVRAIPEVLTTESFVDYVPPGTSPERTAQGLRDLRSEPVLGVRIRELIDDANSRAAVVVRTTDMGTRRAEAFGQELQRLGAVHLGDAYEMQIAGQWWLAQRGMQRITRDMLVSFFTSCLLILPLLVLVLRRTRLFLISIVSNVLPLLFALGFAVWAGISFRIGTAMILAIALGIAVDDTIHFMTALQESERRHTQPWTVVEAALRRVARPMLYTSVVLVAGFLSMISNDLLAIRDMGVLASATLVMALLTDLYLIPALYLTIARAPRAVATPIN